MSTPDSRIEAIFHEALAGAPAERETFVVQACAGNESLQREVQRLLAAHEEAGTYFERPNSPEIEAELARLKAEEVGEQIGPYKLMEQIGEGGFGTVWVADQEWPVRRHVALKIIKLGMDTKEVNARFEQERQALAIMDHPHIAKVLDAGATQWGRPYFVMEWVRGTRITDYCDQANLPTADRLALFIQVCNAVQHAHQKGIIHRDLKPSNILVTLHDGEPVPKVIDFGVAKAIQQQRLTDLTIYTQFEQMIGTPLYMSPEQAEMSGLNVDTRTDIYALGVLLYELLTGRTPFDAGTLMNVSYEEMRRVIREQEPPKPSTALHTMAPNVLTAVARHRQSEPPKLIHALRGDLDWIVMKALEKDRARRYETANGFAMDVQRHLQCEPVVARPPSRRYRFERLYRRNKLSFVAGGAVVVSLVIGIAVSLWQAVRANRALDELRATAPAFAEQARALAANERFDEAIDKLDYALKLRQDWSEYLVSKGDLLQCQFKLAEAAAIYREALRVKPGLARAEASAKLCEELLAAPHSEEGKLTRESLARLYLVMQHQQRPTAELMPVARLLGEEEKLIIEYWLVRLKDLPVSADKPLQQRLTVREDGLLALDLSGTKVANLSPLTGMPIGSLNLTGCQQIADFTPLHAFRSLTSLNLDNTKVTDLSPLSGLPLDSLHLNGTEVFDIAALREMKLKRLSLRDTRVSDLTPLARMPLTYIDTTAIPAADYSPLAGAPLEECIIQNSPLNDLSFLRDSPVKELTLFGCKEARGFVALTGLKSLNLLILPQNFRDFPDEELKAILALRNHPTLRNIQSEPRSGGGWMISTTLSKDAFWRKWDDERALVGALRGGGFRFTLTTLPNGTYRLVIQDQPFSDLSILKGMPVSDLILTNTKVSNLRPLEDLALTTLDLGRTHVTDLTPLRAPTLRASLRSLQLWKIPATDFSPVAACANLDFLDAAWTALADLEVVRGFRLRGALLAGTKVTDISALAGMPLERMTLNDTGVTDVSPLLQCPTLMELTLPAGARDVTALRSLSSLVKISYREFARGVRHQTAAEFWTEYEGGGLTAEGISSLSEESAEKPEDTLMAMKVAAVQVWFRKDADHAATSQRMLKWVRDSKRPQDMERVAKLACLRATQDTTVVESALALAQKAMELGKGTPAMPWYEMALGMAEYRNGHFSDAERTLGGAVQAIRDVHNFPEHDRLHIEAVAGFYRVLSIYRQGRETEARELFVEIAKDMKPVPADEVNPLACGADGDPVIWLAYKEAKALLQMDAPLKPG